MLNLNEAPRLNLAALDKHVYMSDLVYVEGSILALFRDTKHNWLYLWCDTDNKTTERWLLFPVTRLDLIAYLKQETPLRTLVINSKKRWILDYANNNFSLEKGKSNDLKKTFSRVLREIKELDFISPYFPSNESFFSTEFAPNISTDEELSPTLYKVPIDGDWFIKDLDNFSNIYSQIYAFFYCTKPQFMTDIGSRVHRYLKAPWKGGFSRINLFDALQRMVPAIHDLKIHQMEYASPGDITIEALKSVGNSVKQSVLRYRAEELAVISAVKSLNTVLGTKELKRTDLSNIVDEKLPLAKEDKVYLLDKMQIIAAFLNIEAELKDLSSRSPNIIVSAKVLLAIVARIGRLAEFQNAGLLDLDRQEDLDILVV